MLLNPSSSSHHTVRPNKLKSWSLEQREVYCQVKRGEQSSSCSKCPNSLMILGKSFYNRIWWGGLLLGDLPQLVGGELTGWWSRNLNHQSSGSNQSGVHMLVLSLPWGRDLSSCSGTQICIRLPCVTLGRTRTLPHHCAAPSWPPLLCFCVPSLSSLISICLNLSFVTQGGSKWLNETSFLQTRNEGRRKDLNRQRVGRGPIGSC